jgi:ferredoxin-NADP reductase
MTVDPEDVRDLLVVQIRREAVGVVSLDLVDPEGRALPPWEPGAHIDVFLPSGLVRQYSLCGDHNDAHRYQIAVLLEPESRGGSQEIHETGLVGKTISIRGPRNHFHLEPAPHYLFLAGGIGVTPILAMVEEAERRGTPWRLVYGGRSRLSMAFLERVAVLEGGEVEIVPEDELGFPNFDAILTSIPAGTGVYSCGPPGMLAALEDRCAVHLEPSALHLERFTAPEIAEFPVEYEESGEFEVVLQRTGTTLTVPADKTVLATIRQVLPRVLYACEEGYCGTCETRVLEGIPDHRDVILSDDEHAANNTMMICVSRSRTPKLVLDL